MNLGEIDFSQIDKYVHRIGVFFEGAEECYRNLVDESKEQELWYAWQKCRAILALVNSYEEFSRGTTKLSGYSVDSESKTCQRPAIPKPEEFRETQLQIAGCIAKASAHTLEWLVSFNNELPSELKSEKLLELFQYLKVIDILAYSKHLLKNLGVQWDELEGLKKRIEEKLKT